MKKILLFICFSFLSLNFTFGQVTTEVENGIFVTFPSNPKYAVTNNVPSYSALTENSLLMVLVQRTIPNYVKYVESKKDWTSAEVKTVEDSFLDSAVKGKLDYTGNKGKVTEIRKGEYNGREIDYNAINPATGERGKRFSTIILVRDKIVSFEVYFLVDNNLAELEKDKFFNSIRVEP